MKKYLLVLMIAISNIAISQVGIGTDLPDGKSMLDIVSPDNDKGILVPRLTEAQRDAISPAEAQNGLMIYNTTEDCFNYWNRLEDVWSSICGQLGKGQITFDCDQVKVRGVYIEGNELNSSHYLSITVDVTKAGSYTIIGETNNGYSFYTTGVFLATGIQTVMVPAQGTPIAVQKDEVKLSVNGEEKDCTASPVTVDVLTAAGTYTMSCANAKVYGVYRVGVTLDVTNYISIPVTVTVAGSWSISTNTVEGISFSGSGVFSAPGTYNVRLDGSGVPHSTNTKTLTLTNNSAGALNTSCDVSVDVVIPKKRLLAIGTGTTYGYNVSNIGRPSNTLITSLSNFGPNEESTFKFEGWDQIINGGNGPAIADWNTYLLGANPVDIVVIGFSWNMTDAHALSMIQYLRRGGVVIMFTEGASGNQRAMRTLFNDETLTQATAGGTGDGRTYNLPLTNDPVLNGVFGDIRGQRWGDDATDAVYFTNLPASDIFVYSNAMNANNNTGTVSGSVTGFRHLTFNYIWIGEGGFTSQSGFAGDLTSSTICPFLLDSNNKPIPKTTYGPAGTLIYNSTFFANAMVWAIRQAEYNGINTIK